MGQISAMLRNSCCGSTGEKEAMVLAVSILEKQVIDMQSEIDEYNRLRGNKEKFAQKCFVAGRESVHAFPTNATRAWFNFRSLEL